MTDKLVRQQLGSYTLLKSIGQDSFANIYLGEHILRKKQVHIKVPHTDLSKKAVEKFLIESNTLNKLEHPHIVQVRDFGVQDSILFLITDDFPNGILRQHFPKNIPVQPTSILPYVKKIAEILQFVHDKKFVHRDIKPENILL